MSALNQQTLVESRANDRPPILGKGNYIPWESWFRRFLENKGDDMEKMWCSITKGPYLRPMIPDPDNPRNQIPEPLSKMTEANRKRYTNDVRERIRRLMYGLKKNKNVIYSRLMNEFDKFEAKEGESLDSVYERLSTLVNVMDRNDIRPLKPHVQASKANKVAKNHYSLALIAYSNAYSSQSHASSSYSHSPQPYYVTHPSSVVDSEEDYLRELQRDAQEDKLITAMMLLAQAVTQKFSTPTNNRLCTSSNTRNQAVINDGRVDIQTKNAGYGRNGNKNAGRQNRNQAANAGNGHYARDCPKPKVRDVKYFREQMLLAMKDEAGGTLNDEENDFMLDNAYEDETLEELTAVVIMMVQIQPTDDNAETELKNNVEVVSEVNALHIDLIISMISKGVHEHTNHEKLKTVINTSDDDQIDCNIIFDDPYVEIMVDQLNMIQMLMINFLILKPWHTMFKEKLKINKDLILSLNSKKSCYKRSLRRVKNESKHLNLNQLNVQNIKKHVMIWNAKYELIKTPSKEF
ncbi:hypothetical protein Tco_1516765 [Tanacetum coccineum]